MFHTTHFGIYKDSPKANSVVLIFKKNKLFGKYHLGGKHEIPTIDGYNLVFPPNKWEDCNLTTTINLKDSLPEQIFIQCMNENDTIIWGDLFRFYKELDE